MKQSPYSKRLDDALAKAKSALAKGLFQQAVEQCESLTDIANPPEYRVEGFYISAVAHRYVKQFQQANALLAELFALAPTHARAWQERGHLYLAQAKGAEAAHAFHQATSHNPALVTSWRPLIELYRKQPSNRGSVSALANAQAQLDYWSRLPRPLQGSADLLYSGDLEKADKVCRQFLQANKHHVDGLYVLAVIDVQAKFYDEAEFLLESCCELSPKHERARSEYAALLNRIGKYSVALKQAELLLESVPSNLNYQVLAGVANIGLGRMALGIDQLNGVLEQEPQRPGLWLQLGHAYKSVGEFDSAEASYKKALHYRSDYGDAYWSLANTKAYRFTADELKQMQALLEKPLQIDDRVHIEFALGKGQEDLNCPHDAFEHYTQGNKIKYEQSRYSPEQFSKQVADHKAFFTPSFFENSSQNGCNDSAPIFIVGLPRAGSTLLEQILSSHSQVDATMELHNILSLAKRLNRKQNYPSMLAQTDPTYFTQFGKQYIEQTQAYRQSGKYFIDKMPNNFMHIGLIKRILPNAKVIDARRNPMDCCYSAFKQLFGEGQDFSYDLEAVGQYYRDYEAIMEHWDNVLPGFVLHVQHEDVLDDLEGQVRRMLAFCNLDFESACLTFYETNRAIQTPSSAQVRRPINRDGVDAWKAVESNLNPLIQALAR